MSIFLGEESAEILKDSYSEFLQNSRVFPKLLEILEKLQNAETKPEDPMDYIRRELGDKPIPLEEISGLKRELEDAFDEIRRLQLILKKLGLKYDEEDYLNVSSDAPKEEADEELYCK